MDYVELERNWCNECGTGFFGNAHYCPSERDDMPEVPSELRTGRITPESILNDALTVNEALNRLRRSMALEEDTN